MAAIVIIEDEPLIRMLACEMLEEAGYTVVEFCTAAQAKAFCDAPENEIAAVVTDINMPGGMDGIELARHVAKTRPQVPIVVTSGRFDGVPTELASRVSFLQKPWTQAQLLHAFGNVPP